jgi:transcriptional regulator with XRE-family HTH domain
MESSIGQRIFIAHLELSYRLGRRVTLVEFGQLIAKRLRRRTPFAPTAVSRWEAGQQTPTPEVIEAIAELTGVDPGWISHGSKSAAPAPRSRADLEASTALEQNADRPREATAQRKRFGATQRGRA